MVMGHGLIASGRHHTRRVACMFLYRRTHNVHTLAVLGTPVCWVSPYIEGCACLRSRDPGMLGTVLCVCVRGVCDGGWGDGDVARRSDHVLLCL